MKKNNIKILLVEDDPNLSMVLQDYLEMMNYDIHLSTDGAEGYRAFRTRNFDLCILDVMMPKKDGFTLAEEIRKSNNQVPIIFLTAKSLKEDRIKGFHAGADDYITKPFSTEELSLRIKAILKRTQINLLDTIGDEDEVYDIGKYLFDYRNMTLTLGDETRTLTRKEAGLLKLLCLNKNNLLQREIALKTIWGENDYFIGRSMDVFIAKLRKYLKEDPTISITNVHGMGFKLIVKNS
ncbi:MAG: response regulator transcription factor [Bacteroidota bacterium]|nr:response regulator transcription factor [Bacteroidota bacterium]